MAFAIHVDGKRRVQLGRGDRVVLGRASSCDVVLTDPACSREHLEISLDRWSSAPCYRDLESRNGTALNGRRATQGLLAEGVVLELGVHRVRVLPVEPLVPPAVIDDADEQIQFPFDVGPELEIDLRGMPGSVVLARLRAMARTGTLRVDLATAQFELLVAAGEPIKARGAPSSVAEATRALASASAGTCVFKRAVDLAAADDSTLIVDRGARRSGSSRDAARD